MCIRDRAEIVDGGITYLTICSCVSFGLFFGITFERILQSTGRTLYTMFTLSLIHIYMCIRDSSWATGRGTWFWPGTAREAIWLWCCATG